MIASYRRFLCLCLAFVLAVMTVLPAAAATAGAEGRSGSADTSGDAGASGSADTSCGAGTAGETGTSSSAGTAATAGASDPAGKGAAAQASASQKAAAAVPGKSPASGQSGKSTKNGKTAKKSTKKSGKSKKKDLSVLKKSLKKKISSYGGAWSVYVKDLKADKSISINDRQMYAASLIKLYAMGAALEQVKKGKLKSSSVSALLDSMITVSDNASFNQIVGRVGKKTVNSWIKKNRFKKTRVVHDVGLAANSTIVRDRRACNTTSAADCGKFLETVYRGKCVSSRASKVMLGLLKRQTRRGKIPAGVPSGVAVANKTGETDETCHDAAIVFVKKNPYILVVMVTSPGNAWTKNSEIAAVSRLVYDFFRK